MAGRDHQYRKARKELLASRPLCYWCKEKPATTADHEPPLSAFPDPSLWRGVLLPACLSCNSSRGAKFGNARRKLPRRSRNW